MSHCQLESLVAIIQVSVTGCRDVSACQIWKIILCPYYIGFNMNTFFRLQHVVFLCFFWGGWYKIKYQIRLHMFGWLDYYTSTHIIWNPSRISIVWTLSKIIIPSHGPEMEVSQVMGVALNQSKSFIPIGSMVLGYMLTWLGYIHGIHGTPYI